MSQLNWWGKRARTKRTPTGFAYSSEKTRPVRLTLETLESRVTPTVTASIVGTTLQISIDGTGPDLSAFISSDGTNVNVGTTSGGNQAGTFALASFNAIDVLDTAAAGGQSVTFDGATNIVLTGTVTSTGIESVNIGIGVTGSSGITISGATNIAFSGAQGQLNAGSSNISATASNSILTTATSTADFVGNQLTLSAGAGGIGTSTNPIYTTVTSVQITTTGGSNAFLLETAAGVAFTGTSSISGNLNYVVTGALTDNAGASLTVTGNATLNASSITLNDTNNFGSLTFSSTGAVTIVTASGIDLTGTNTANSLSLTANGAITDQAGTSLTVTNNATFNAGANAITLGDNASDTTNFGNLTATGGAITITEDSGMALNLISGTTVVLTSQTGAITDNNGASNNIAATSVVLTASTGIGTTADFLEMTVSNLEATTTTGSVVVANTGALTIGGISGVNGVSAGTDVLLSASSLSITENLSAGGAGAVRLLTSTGGISQTGGTITGGSLGINSAGAVTLTQSNDITTLAANVTGAFSYTDSTGFNLATVAASGPFTSGVTGVTSTGTVTFSAGAAVTQTAGAGVSGTGIVLLGNGSYTLSDQANNSVPTLAADTNGGSIDFRTTGGLQVTTIGATSGIQTGNPANGGNVTLRSTTGLTVSQPINTQLGSGGTLTIGGGVTLAASITIGAGSVDLGGGQLDILVTSATVLNVSTTLAASRDVLISAPLSTSSGNLVLRGGDGFGGVNAGGVRIFNTGSVSSAGTLTILGKDLNQTLNSTPPDAVRIDAGSTGVSAASNVTIGINTAAGGAAPITSRVFLNAPVNGDAAGEPVTISAASSGAIELSSNVLSNGASVTFTSPVVLTGNSVVNTTSGAINFNQTVDGSFNLDLTTTGTATFSALVGATTRLASLNSSTTSTVQLNANTSVGQGGATSSLLGNTNLNNIILDFAGPLTLGDASTDDVTLQSTSNTLRSTNASTATVNARVTGGSTFRIDVAGASVILNNTANNYTGSTFVDAGTMNLRGGIIGAGAGSIFLNTGTTLDGFNGAAKTGTITGRGVVVQGANATVQRLLQLTNSATGTGILVSPLAGALILDNGTSAANGITGNRIGIDVNNGLAFIENNFISNNTGAGSDGISFAAGLRIRGTTPQVDAGQPVLPAPLTGHGYDFVGLNGGGVGQGSSGNNVFNGYTLDPNANATTKASPSLPTVPQAIINLKSGGLSGTPGPQGAPDDVLAQNNTYNGIAPGTNYPDVEQLVYHDYDSSTRGFTNYTTPVDAAPTLVGSPLFFSVNAPTEADIAGNALSYLQRSMIRQIRLAFEDFVYLGMSGAPNTRAVQVERLNAQFGGGPLNNYFATGGTFQGFVDVQRIGPIVFNPLSTLGRYFNYDFGFVGINGREVSGSLVDGQYLLKLEATRIQSIVNQNEILFTPPNPLLLNDGLLDLDIGFHRLFGDVNGDGVTSSTIPTPGTSDLAVWNTTYRSRLGMTNYIEFLDFDNDRDVDAQDYTQFYRRLDRY